jgi:hypothetical protein
VEGAGALVRDDVFDTMKEPERETFARWREVQGVAEGQVESGGDGLPLGL